jgi:hypothetical protein
MYLIEFQRKGGKNMNIKLPYEQRQKFQVGDICKIVEKGIYQSQLEYPPKDLETWKQDRECIILYTYSQVYWGNNFSDYSVYLLPRNNNEYVGSLAWIEENQLRFVRKPTENEIKMIINEDNKMLSYINCPYTSIFN